MMTKRVIATTEIKRDRTKLYCCGTDEKGNLTILEVERSARSQGKKDKE